MADVLKVAHIAASVDVAKGKALTEELIRESVDLA
jgi:hypothetical protein